MNAKFSCPEFFYGERVYKLYFELFKINSYLLNPNTEIATIFGNFGDCIWNGGSHLRDNRVTSQNLQYIKNVYATFDIPLRLTMTNPLLIESDLYDRYANFIVRELESDINEITVCSPILENYLRTTYPKYKFNRSILATKDDPKDPKFYEDLLNTYHNIVLSRRYTKDFKFLESIKPEYRDRIELLCNDVCPVSCPYLYEHYSKHARCQLYEQGNENFSCVSIDYSNLEESITQFLKYRKDQITPQEITTYLDLGYSNFKLSGRGSDRGVLFSTAQYLIKPEYLYDFLKFCVMNIIY